jgi:diacylglycerol kinase family enzyme
MDIRAQAGSPPGRDRALAAVSLIGLAVGVALLAVEAVVNIRGIAVAAAGVAVAVWGGWYALTRRGTTRAAGIGGVVAGGLILAAGVAAVELTWWRVVLIVACAALSEIAAARVLGATGDDAVAVAGSIRAASGVLLMNPLSGGGKAERFGLAEECRARGIAPIMLRPGDDLTQLAEDAVAGGADVLGMAGGDGSQALVAEVASRHDIPMVVVPAGTRNHFALDLGIDRTDVVGALDGFTDGVERRVDLATVNGRVFVNNASLGLYAQIVQSPGYRAAKKRTAAAMLPDLLGPAAEAPGMRFTDPDGNEYAHADVILVGNDPYALDGISGQGTRDRLDRGVLGVVAVEITGPTDVERFTALEAIGKVRRYSGWREWTAQRFHVDADDAVPIALDGEASEMQPPLEFRSQAGALRVRLPAAAAARRRPGARPTPARLWAIASGRDGTNGPHGR